MTAAGLAVRVQVLEARITEAQRLAAEYGDIDGDHHKMWVIDQMVRALTGCNGDVESDEYKQFIDDYELHEDGARYYDWEVGIAP